MQTYAGRIEIYNAACRQAAEQALRDVGVAFTRYDGEDWWQFDVEAITAEQYDGVIDSMTVAGAAGDDWNFPLD